MSAPSERPPSVDALARSLAPTGLPHAILVDVAREAISAGSPESALGRAESFRRSLLTPVVNATGVLLHTNLGRAPQPVAAGGRTAVPGAADGATRAVNVEFDVDRGRRGSRQHAVGSLFARLCGAEAAMVVNNNAAAVLLVLAALAAGRHVPVSRGESVEIGGSFRVPEVIAQSGARLVDVGTTNRTRVEDYRRVVEAQGSDVALILKVHPSNYRVEGFAASTDVAELATLGVPVVVDLGSGLVDADCPWLGGPPAWLADEPAARQTLGAGAALVTFSGDKLLGGPQAGIIAGRAELVERCMRHPLARAVRPGGLVLTSLQELALDYLDKRVAVTVPFWQMAAATPDSLRRRAEAVVAAVADVDPSARVVPTDALPGAGSAPGATIDSFGIELDGDRTALLRRHDPPVIARARDDRTVLDVRSVAPADDAVLVDALRAAATA